MDEELSKSSGGSEQNITTEHRTCTNETTESEEINRTPKKLKIEKFSGENIQVYQEGNKTIIEALVPTRLEIDKEEQDWLEMEVVHLYRLQKLGGGRLVTQAELGEAFGVSRQMINRRWRTQEEEGLVELLRLDYEKSKRTPEVIERITQLVISDWWLSEEKIAQKLIEEELVDNISAGCVRDAIAEMDGLRVRELMRERIQKERKEHILNQDWVIERCFEIIEGFLSGDGLRAKASYEEICFYKEQYSQEKKTRGPYKMGRHLRRVNLKRDIARKRRRIEKILNGEWSIWDLYKRRPYCYDCGSLIIGLKEERGKKYTDHTGELVYDKAQRFYCRNHICSTKTFTILPPGLEHWARFSVRAKAKMLKQIFHVRGSYQRVCDYLADEDRIKVQATTALSWVRKAGAEVPALEDIIKTSSSGVICFDEKWVKLRSQWIYIYKAVDGKTGELLTAEVFPSRGQDSAKALLYQAKILGYTPKVSVTDLITDYDKPLKKVFPDSIHHKCVLHAEKAANKLLREALPETEQESLQHLVKNHLHEIFKQKEFLSLEESYKKFIALRNDFPRELEPVFQMMERYYPYLEICLRNKGLIPLTNNAAEHVISEFDRRYEITGGFSSIHSVREFLRCFVIYYRLRRFRSQQSLKSYRADQLSKLTRTEFLLAA